MKSTGALLLALILSISSSFLLSAETKEQISLGENSLTIVHRNYILSDDFPIRVLNLNTTELSEEYYRVTDEDEKELLYFVRYSAVCEYNISEFIKTYYTRQLSKNAEITDNGNEVIFLDGSFDSFIKITLFQKEVDRLKINVEYVRYYDYLG